MSLDLNEKIGIWFTREERAVILIGLAHVSMTPKLEEHAAAPVGVLSRTLVKNGRGEG